MFGKTLLRRIACSNLNLKSRKLSGKPRLAIVGSGPAGNNRTIFWKFRKLFPKKLNLGMFACNGLLRKSNFSVDVFENSPVPFGLVRYGVAPDHQEVRFIREKIKKIGSFGHNIQLKTEKSGKNLLRIAYWCQNTILTKNYCENFKISGKKRDKHI